MVLKFKNRKKFPKKFPEKFKVCAPVLTRIAASMALANLFVFQTLIAANAQNPATELDPARPLITREQPPLRPGVQTQPSRPPSDIPGAPVFKPLTSNIESGDLAPIRDGDGSGLPIGVWQGLDAGTLEKLFAKIDLPPRSPTMNRLWLKLLTSPASFGGGKAGIELKVLRLEALFRSGHFRAIIELPADSGRDRSGHHMTEFIKAKAELGLGQAKAACARLKSAGAASSGMPKGLAVELLKMTIYCRAHAGDIAGANLVVNLAREQGIGSTYATRAVLALEAKKTAAPKLPKKPDLVDYSFTALFPKAHLGDLIEKASAPVLSAMLNDQRQPQAAYLRIAERCLRLNIIEPKTMTEIYSRSRFEASELNDPRAAITRYQNRPEGRALLYRALQDEREPTRRAELAKQLLMNARRAGLYGPIAKLLGDTLLRLPQSNALQWFTEPAIEIALASGQYEKALSWSVFGSASVSANPHNHLNWLTLIDIGAPENVVPNGAGLAATEEAALAGSFSPQTLHRLVTVLDALKYDVPIQLWNRASASPQPTSGHLPETGILSELEVAASSNQYGKVILYSMIALGRDGPQGAHIIALGDTIKAMSKAGMQDEARNIGLEALYSVWPRLASN